MLRELFCHALLFPAAILGGGAALAPSRRHFAPLEAWCVGLAAAVGVLALGVFTTYVTGLPDACFASGFLVLAIVALIRRRALVELARDPDVREAALAWLLLTLGCLALLACVVSYNGGFWTGDWEEQYQRPLLFLRLRAEDADFQRLVVITGRPPLANLADAALLWFAGAGFASHQIAMLLLNSLAFFPAALFARTLGRNRAAIALVALLLLLNPLFLQNTTYAWTKLLTAFFVLTALHLLLTGSATRARVVAAAMVFGLAVVTHYSACVWLLVFGSAWFFAQRARWAHRDFRRTLGRAALAFSAVLAPWLLYAVARYGLRATFASNTSATAATQFTWWENLAGIVPKFWKTLVPHPLRTFDRSLLDQTNSWTLLRDQFFTLYQTNLLFAVGTPALVALLWLALRHRREFLLPPLWLVALPAVTILGTAVHPGADEWGLVHICLQPLVPLALAVVAARLPELLPSAGARLLATLLALGALADFTFGIALHYSATALALNRPPDQDVLAYLGTLNRVARYNLWQKVRLGQDWFADGLHLSVWHAFALFLALALLLALRAFRLAATPAPYNKNPHASAPPFRS